MSQKKQNMIVDLTSLSNLPCTAILDLTRSCNWTVTITEFIHISHSMVLHIIRSDILRVAYYFYTSNAQNFRLVLYVKPSNKRFLIPLQKDFVILASLFC